jgi:hypothetical protein
MKFPWPYVVMNGVVTQETKDWQQNSSTRKEKLRRISPGRGDIKFMPPLPGLE